MTKPRAIQDSDLVIHFLNVGFGDTTLIEFPATLPAPDGGSPLRYYGLVDCRDADKVRGYIEALQSKRPARSRLAFVCATHPHADHISGMRALIDDDTYRPDEFWDSGFRHSSQTYRGILAALDRRGVPLLRVSSGMEWYFGKVQVTALAPSVALRNRYATYGVDINNASIVLRLEHRADSAVITQSSRYQGGRDPDIDRDAGKSVVILGADAEFDSWSQISHEYPHIERSSAHEPLVKKMVNPLACRVIKVAHHGSMHSSPLDIYERMKPALAVISTEQEYSAKGQRRSRGLFPHRSAALALEEVGARVATTDGSYESEPSDSGGQRDRWWAHPGSVVVVVPPSGQARWRKLDDKAGDLPEWDHKV